MTEFWANKKFKQFQNEGCQFDWCRRRCSIISWGLFSCCCLDAVQLTHTLSWQLAIVFVAFGMAGVNKTLLENVNLSCSSQISFFWSVFFCLFWGNDKAAHRESAGQRCSFLIHSHKIISRKIINMFHSSDLCISLPFFSSDSWVSFKTTKS